VDGATDAATDGAADRQDEQSGEARTAADAGQSVDDEGVLVEAGDGTEATDDATDDDCPALPTDSSQPE
jgi:hypothetical protein